LVSDDGPGADAIRVVPESWTVVERRSGQYRLSVGPLSERIVALTVGLAKTSTGLVDCSRRGASVR